MMQVLPPSVEHRQKADPGPEMFFGQRQVNFKGLHQNELHRQPKDPVPRSVRLPETAILWPPGPAHERLGEGAPARASGVLTASDSSTSAHR